MWQRTPENLTTSIYKALLLAGLTALIIIIAWKVIDVLFLTFAAILLAIFFRSLGNFIKKKTRFSDTLSTTIALAFLILVSVLIALMISPTINEQFQRLMQEMPGAWHKLQVVLTETFNFDFSLGLQEAQVQQLFNQGKALLVQAANLFTTTFGLLGSAIFLIFIAIFFAYDPDIYLNGLLKLLPSYKRPRAAKLLNTINTTLRWWLIGKLISMAIVGIFTSFGLWLMGVPLALTLGLLAALLTFIPNLGPILSAIPAVLLGLIQGPLLAFYVVILYVVIQAIESYVITPVIQNRTIAQPPALVIIAQLIMALLTGILGLALATPLLAVLGVIIDELYTDKVPSLEHKTD